MNKYRTLFKIYTLLCGAVLMVSCASDDETTIKIWRSTSTIQSSSAISKPSARISSNGDIALVWREQETEVRPDQEKDTLHTYADAEDPNLSHANLHNHFDMYSRWIMHVKRYDASAEAWSDDTSLATGYWQKIKSGTLTKADARDMSKIVYEENISVFEGDVSLAMNNQGDTVLAWVQLTESTSTTGDASSSNGLMVARYLASSNAWSTPSEVTLVDNTILKNDVAVSLNTDGKANLIWTAKNSSSLLTLVYGASFDGTTFSAAELISGEDENASDVNMLSKDGSSGIATWLQLVESGNPVSSVRFAAYSRWYNSADWSVAPVQINTATATIKHYKLADNGSGTLWMVSEQGDIASENAAIISVNQFSGDIATDLTSGSWSVDKNVQTGGASADLSQAQIAVDSSGNVLVAWLESEKNIRANSYTKSTDKWLGSSFLVNNSSVLAGVTATGGKEPAKYDGLKVISPSNGQFMLNWQNPQGVPKDMGTVMYSVDFDLASSTLSNVNKIATDSRNNITQKDFLVANGAVQLIWASTAAGQTEIMLSAP